MNPLSAEDVERSRKNHAIILSRLASVGQSTVANGIGVHESTISKMKDGDLERFAKIAAVLGLKVVPVEMKCYPADKMDAILILARSNLNEISCVEQLSFE
ncbi:CII family transcriptional regulator [Solimicrobium silvestre]|uniref:Bacteriophage CII protein n=1 Tax=Solimicrobium silvestre TaxID=2099400 RepID=A0A2S9GZB1_9BURK|nr:CII family transcriptional regulator [Solimicrobium silvestre]PRC93072.1 Bacteriophage CII protein [Solimicrobium silvestre]